MYIAYMLVFIAWQWWNKVIRILQVFLSFLFIYIYIYILKKLGFTPYMAEQPLQDMELQEKEGQKD